LTAATQVSGTDAGCPNGNWKGVNPVLTVTSITLQITQTNSFANSFYNCTVSNSSGLSAGDITFPISC
jgi:hypothetical protein